MSKPERIVCERCSSLSVTRDAWAEWDEEAQAWALGAVFDYAYCHDCDAETHLASIDLPQKRKRPRSAASK